MCIKHTTISELQSTWSRIRRRYEFIFRFSTSVCFTIRRGTTMSKCDSPGLRLCVVKISIEQKKNHPTISHKRFDRLFMKMGGGQRIKLIFCLVWHFLTDKHTTLIKVLDDILWVYGCVHAYFCEGRISVLKRWFKTPIQNAVNSGYCSSSSEPERRLYDVI